MRRRHVYIDAEGRVTRRRPPRHPSPRRERVLDWLFILTIAGLIAAIVHMSGAPA